jgi:hypothetical protein
VFAGCGIEAGEEILVFSGPIVTSGDVPQVGPAEHDYYLQIEEDLFLGPSGSADDFVNHSCDPNAGVVVHCGGARLVAIKPISSGEEVTFDYSTTMYKAPVEMECHCMSTVCRGRIRDFLSLPERVQEKYVSLGVVPDYILAKPRQPQG